jgi:hypothetical protein
MADQELRDKHNKLLGKIKTKSDGKLELRDQSATKRAMPTTVSSARATSSPPCCSPPAEQADGADRHPCPLGTRGAPPAPTGAPPPEAKAFIELPKGSASAPKPEEGLDGTTASVSVGGLLAAGTPVDPAISSRVARRGRPLVNHG